MSTTAKSIQWQWDRGGRKLWAHIHTSNGQKVSVGFPLSTVAMTFDEELGRCGCVEPAMVGDYESVDGFLSRVKRVAKKATPKKLIASTTRSATRGFVPQAVWKKAVPKAIQKTHAKLAQKAVQAHQAGYDYGKKYGMAAARSKTLGAGLGATAVAFPAVGGPALGAWVAANRAVTAYDRAMAAKQQIQRGLKNPQAVAALAKGQAVQAAVRRLPYSTDPRARFATQALRSIPQVRRAAQSYYPPPKLPRPYYGQPPRW